MARTKYNTNRKTTVKRNSVLKKTQKTRQLSQRTRQSSQSTRQSSQSTQQSSQSIQLKPRYAFNFDEIYYFHVPQNYINNEFEDASVKHRFINELVKVNELFIKNLNEADLDNICKEHRDLTNNLKMQSSGSLVLYIENFGKVVAATSISLDFDTGTNYEDINSEEEEKNRDEWKVNEVRILTFCSKSPGYGTKLMNKILALVMVGNENGYVTDDVRIVLNCTESSKSFYTNKTFYLNKKFTCDNNNLCTLMPFM